MAGAVEGPCSCPERAAREETERGLRERKESMERTCVLRRRSLNHSALSFLSYSFPPPCSQLRYLPNFQLRHCILFLNSFQRLFLKTLHFKLPSYLIHFTQLAARGVKVDIGPPKGAAPPWPDHTPQDAITKATPSSRPNTPAISMTAALKDVGVVSPHTVNHLVHSFTCFGLGGKANVRNG